MMYYAHSPDKKKGIGAQSYEGHICGVMKRAEKAAERLCKYAHNDRELFFGALKQAAEFHDLGKLDKANQEILSGEKKAQGLPIPHADAGAAYFLNRTNRLLFPAMIIQAHHSGYNDLSEEKIKEQAIFRNLNSLAGDQNDITVMEYVNKTLPDMVKIHGSLIQNTDQKYDPAKGDMPVLLRLMLSCMADADHTDTAVHYKNYDETEYAAELKPAERLKLLDSCIDSMKNKDDPKSPLRNKMYHACRDADTNSTVNSCDSPVGSGKTTAVMAHLLRQAKKRGLRRIIVVLPFTNIIKQSVDRYRKTLVFPWEDPEKIVAELHHRADFQNPESRHLTALWKAPIIVTTAVTFFETLASDSPATLRRLHELPGSAVFIDESHAALPAKLLPLAWRWINIYAAQWNCYWVLASGSLNRFWEIKGINNDETCNVPELLDDKLRSELLESEKKRIRYQYDSAPKNIEEIASWVTSFKGPRLLILNTVQSAAAMADYFRKHYGEDNVEHLSTALTSVDREDIIDRVKKRLEDKSDTDWTFIATSCVEAGLDFSFRNGFRECCSLVSLLQASGRINRNDEYDDSEIWTFKIAEGGLLRKHPSFKDSAAILQKYFEDNIKITPELSTQSIEEEIVAYGRSSEFMELVKYERNNEFKKVEELFKVISTDTRITLVDKELIAKIRAHKKVDWQTIQKNSVQIRKCILKETKAEEILSGIYEWPLTYDNFIGYMAGVLPVAKFTSGADINV
ncbi:CRISPR-associated endonuclease Cas3'' [Treponema primitia]|uniref:CRISPR-associated endonuclease Cas3'' n=1 Tax=Treponema primitia TaxID=88058 RepID=UPI0039802346